MSDNITSNNQSGGITAKNVNLNLSQIVTEPPIKKSSWWKIISATIGILAAIAAILTYFGIEPYSRKETMGDQGPVYNVNSINQQGGITAGNVNIGSQQRTVTPANRDQLRQHVPKDKKVTVVAVMGDAEAFNYAQQIFEVLKQDGYNVSGVDQALHNPPIMGQVISPKGNDSIEVIVGTRKAF